MIILNTRKIEFVDGVERLDGPVEWVPSIQTQYDAVPTTQEETVILETGNCPKCNDKLAGETGKFCVRDQIEWMPEVSVE
jgi:hypothetical protein